MEFVLFRKMTMKLDKFTAHFDDTSSKEEIQAPDKSLTEVQSRGHTFSSSEIESLPESKKQEIEINEIISSLMS